MSRRQIIKGGMIAGGVALWSTPMVAAAKWGRFDRVRSLAPLTPSGGPAAPTGTPQSEGSTNNIVSPCTGYPPGECMTFTCGGLVTICGEGALGFRCFCDHDVEGNCVCSNDAPCKLLSSCSASSECPPGWACIPSSCCTGAKCAPPCGSFPGNAFSGGPLSAFAGQGTGIPGLNVGVLAGPRMSGLGG